MRLIKIVRNVEAVQTVSMVPLYLQCHPEAEPKDLIFVSGRKYEILRLRLRMTFICVSSDIVSK